MHRANALESSDHLRRQEENGRRVDNDDSVLLLARRVLCIIPCNLHPTFPETLLLCRMDASESLQWEMIDTGEHARSIRSSVSGKLTPAGRPELIAEAWGQPRVVRFT